MPSLKCCGATNAEQEAEADDVQGDDDEASSPARRHSAGVSEPVSRVHREIPAGNDVVAIGLFPPDPRRPPIRRAARLTVPDVLLRVHSKCEPLATDLLHGPIRPAQPVGSVVVGVPSRVRG